MRIYVAIIIAIALTTTGCQSIRATGPNVQRAAISGIAATQISIVLDSVEVEKIDDAKIVILEIANDIDAFLQTGDFQSLTGRMVLEGINLAVDKASLPDAYAAIARNIATMAVVSVGEHYTPNQQLSQDATDRLQEFVDGVRYGVAKYRIADHPQMN